MPAAHGRMFYPKLYIPGARFLFTEGPPPLDEIAEADVVVIQRMMFEQNMQWISIIRQLGIRIIYDLDDNLWQLSSYNPAKGVFKKEEHQRGLEACAEWADVFTVSTQSLAKVVKSRWGHLRNVATKKPIPIKVCENRTPLTLYCHQEGMDNDHEGVIIGWSGSNTHHGDLIDIWHILHKILEDMPEARLEIVGQPPPAFIAMHPRVKLRPWVHISEYPARQATWNWDIVLAPLEYHKFNKSKSSIRMQEAGALHRPCLATPTEPYEEFVAKGDVSLKYLLCTIDMHWDKKLRELVANASLRKELGEAMYANVKENFNITTSALEWQDAIRTAYGA